MRRVMRRPIIACLRAPVEDLRVVDAQKSVTVGWGGRHMG